MQTDVFTPALIQAMGQDLSVPDLIRTAETLKQSGQLGSMDTLYATWIEHNQAHPLLCAVLFNYSVRLADSNRLDAARACLERAIAQNPDFMPAYINLGRVYERLGHANLAVLQWSAALARMAKLNGPAVTYKTTTLNQTARALEAANQDDAAETMLRESLELDCHQREAIQHLVALRQRQCKWPVILPSDRVSGSVLMKGMSPLSAAAFTDDPLLQLALASEYNDADVGLPTGAFTSWPAAIPREGERLKVGYLSSDLREHAVGYLLTEVLALHDRSKVEVFAYYCGPPARDPLHEHFKASVDHWVPITDLDDATAASRMVADGIQILVDLNGYTREARLKLVALRPAPIVVNWLGFPGTMGSPYHHYVVADEWIIPPESERYYSEKVLRLPCYQPSHRTRTVAPAPTRASVGLPEGALVYACFNGAHKINRFTFDRWLLVLAKVPGSVLWLLSSTEGAHARLRAYAAARGIAPERIVFADKLANPSHLARYPLADLFLDTTPYGAHTTASDALFMGVPVLTWSGRSFASRVCGSLVRAAGLPELVCGSAEEYVRRAVELGGDRAALRGLRDRLTKGRDVCTLPRLVRCLEELYAQMAKDLTSGRLPRPDLANLREYLEVGIEMSHEEIEVQTLVRYEDAWRELLARRHRLRPLGLDRRFGDLG
jgi:predicted O-linked N-acetylglucosamine transferase (SPINDLY family)